MGFLVYVVLLRPAVGESLTAATVSVAWRMPATFGGARVNLCGDPLQRLRIP